jgi:hypothetical protein
MSNPLAAKPRSAQAQVRDPFKALPEYVVDPLEVTAIGLKLGAHRMDKARRAAKERGLREFAIVGNASVRVSLRPPADMRPPEPWLHEFVLPRYLAQAQAIMREEG